MFTKKSKNQKRGHIHDRIRKKMQGTAERPRLNVYRSLNHIYVQVIDDLHGQTLVSASSAEGKKEEAIQSVLRPDVVLFSMEVRFANDETLEMARKEWYEKGKADLMAEIRKCTLVARQEI